MPPIPADYVPVADKGYNAYLGSIFMREAPVGTSNAELIFDVGPQHLNSGGTTHGGLLMSIMDTSCGAAVARMVGAHGATISLNCEFLSGAREGDRIAIKTQVIKKTRSIAFVEGRLEVHGKAIMTAQGMWRVFSDRKLS